MPKLKSNKDHPDPDHLIHELTMLQAMVRQEAKQGDIGWGGTWTKEQCQSLKERHPEAYKMFLTRLKVQDARAQHKKDIFERYKRSPYLEQKSRELPEPGEPERYLQKLERLRDLMILKKIGCGDRMIALAFTNLKNSYPAAYETFKRELEDM